MVTKRIKESAFSSAKDPAFRARAVSEYMRIRKWLGRNVNFETSSILDFGCGQGIGAASFALRHPGASVWAVDVAPPDVSILESRLESQLGVGIPENLNFSSNLDEILEREMRFDLIYSWSVFEHVRASELAGLFKKIKHCLSTDGRFFMQVSPLYFSPRGSHLYRYFSSPWHHLTLSIDEIREALFAATTEKRRERGWRQFIELNRLTATDILGQATTSGLKLIRKELSKTDKIPPPSLVHVYNEDALLTEEVIALFR
jgi:2-polyprenyl-3-methyl-5-hydroxy-6-metoxy-1,4-benzoquinol methylase